MEILAVGPDGPGAFGLYWRSEKLPYIGLPDPDHRVARLYKQQVNLFKLGRMPAVLVVDPAGLVRFAQYGTSMSDIPENRTVFEVLERTRGSSAPDGRQR